MKVSHLVWMSLKALHLRWDVEPICPTKHRVIKKKQFDENNQGEKIQLADESFRINYFLVVVDT